MQTPASAFHALGPREPAGLMKGLRRCEANVGAYPGFPVRLRLRSYLFVEFVLGTALDARRTVSCGNLAMQDWNNCKVRRS